MSAEKTSPMQHKIKTVTYASTNSYTTWGALTDATKNIWIVFHGIGYLSNYFLRPFQVLNPDDNYIIAPQAPSKYYLNDDYKYVGASWLTKIDTDVEMQNNLAYLDALMANETIPSEKPLILLGFSQGVSIVMRWMAMRKIQCKKLVIYAGGIPNELNRTDFEYLDFNKTAIHIIYGDNDEFLTKNRIAQETEKANKLFNSNYTVTTFKGGHELNTKIIKDLS